MDERTRYWVELSDYDLGTAEAMLHVGRYLYVGFMCHQAVEKALKAWYQCLRGGIPPRSHNLRLLLAETDSAGEFPAEMRRLLLELEPLNIEARYPENKERLERLLDQERCARWLVETREVQAWIKQRL